MLNHRKGRRSCANLFWERHNIDRFPVLFRGWRMGTFDALDGGQVVWWFTRFSLRICRSISTDSDDRRGIYLLSRIIGAIAGSGWEHIHRRIATMGS